VSSRETNGLEEENSPDENIYLSKILLFTPQAQDLAEKMKPYSESTVSTNCLNTIGMYPLISRMDTPLGKLCMSIWIISTHERFSQFRMAYYSGASHSIILCKNKEEMNSIRDLYLATPSGVPVTILTIGKKGTNITESLPDDFPVEEINRSIFIKNISSIDKLTSVFNDVGLKISQDILSGEYQTFSPQLIKDSNIYKLYNKRSFEKVQDLIGRLGYTLDTDGLVTITKNDFVFEIDFYRNQVKANIAECMSCDKRCKHYRKLCVVEEDQGYSNFVHFDNLRALAILYSIHEGDFTQLSGEKPREDIQNQLYRLQSLYEVNCHNLKDESTFQSLKKKSKKRKK